MDAYERGDMEGVASYYSEDGMILPPGMDTQFGRDGELYYYYLTCHMHSTRTNCPMRHTPIHHDK